MNERRNTKCPFETAPLAVPLVGHVLLDHHGAEHVGQVDLSQTGARGVAVLLPFLNVTTMVQIPCCRCASFKSWRKLDALCPPTTQVSGCASKCSRGKIE